MDTGPAERQEITQPSGEQPQETSSTAGDPLTLDAQKLSLALAEKKLQIVGSVARHDVINQLTAVMGYNELLSTMVQDEQQLQFLKAGQRSSEKMQRILAYSKV